MVGQHFFFFNSSLKKITYAYHATTHVIFSYATWRADRRIYCFFYIARGNSQEYAYSKQWHSLNGRCYKYSSGWPRPIRDGKFNTIGMKTWENFCTPYVQKYIWLECPSVYVRIFSKEISGTINLTLIYFIIFYVFY